MKHDYNINVTAVFLMLQQMASE